MNSAVHWLRCVSSILLGTTMIFCGALFIRGIYVSFFLSDCESIFCSALLAVLLFLTGGVLVCSTVVRLMKKLPK